MERALATYYRQEITNDVQVGILRRNITHPQSLQFLKDVGKFVRDVGKSFDSQASEHIYRALQLMTQVHLDQDNRPDGTAYISHPLSVARDVFKNQEQKNDKPAEYQKRVDSLVAALLHDSVEDQAVKLADLWKKDHRRDDTRSDRELALLYIGETFNPRVAQLVEMVSNEELRQGLGETPEEFKIRKLATYQRHFLHILEDPQAFGIKLADFSNNVLTIEDVADEGKKAKYRRKYGPLIPSVIDKLQDQSVDIRSGERRKLTRRYVRAWEEMGRPTLDEAMLQRVS